VKEEKGFTLLEVLAAVAILGMALAVILQLFSANLRGIAASEEYLAASLAAEAGLREAIETGDLTERAWTETTAEGYRMDISVAPVLQERTESLPVELHQITLTLHFTRGARDRSITLRTMKMAVRKI
jgi:prepilin-type N-terminal cleavage/methylation domain-containing protein